MTHEPALDALDVLKLLSDRAQWCRENGESDMRNILHTASYIKDMLLAGKTRQEILDSFKDEDDDE